MALEGASEGWLYAAADKESKEPLVHLKLDDAAIRCAAFSRDHSKLIIGGDKGAFHVIAIKNSYQQSRLNMTGEAALRSIVWLPDNQHFVTHDDLGNLELWHASEGPQTRIGQLPPKTQWAASGEQSIVAPIPSDETDEFTVYTWQPPEAGQEK